MLVYDGDDDDGGADDDDDADVDGDDDDADDNIGDHDDCEHQHHYVPLRYQLEEFLGRDERNQEDLESLQLHIQEQEGVIRWQYWALLLYLCLCCLYLYL